MILLHIAKTEALCLCRFIGRREDSKSYGLIFRKFVAARHSEVRSQSCWK